MRVLDLFSGIGGFSLGLERAGMTTAAFCEIDPYCRAVLKKHWPGVPIYDDVRTVPRIGGIDLICGGFPCQPFSVAGKQRGKDDDRHLWPKMFEVIQRERPTWVIGENVTGLVKLGLDSVLADLESENYSCRTFIIPAVSVNAPHRRDRLWIVAYAQRDGLAAESITGGFAETTRHEPQGQNDSFDTEGAGGLSTASENVADTNGQRGRLWETRRENAENAGESSGGSRRFDWWDAEPSVGRVAHGVPRRVDRIKSLGNAVVPQIVEKIGKAIMEVSNGHC